MHTYSSASVGGLSWSKELAEKSLQKQADIEAHDSLSFDDFLADYYR